MRGEQISRQWRLLWLLTERPQGASAKELAGELSVSVRTVYRDLDLLERVGIPLVQDREGREVTWRLLEPRTLRFGPFYSPEELVALRRARRALSGNGGTRRDVSNLDALIEKIVSAIPRRVVQDADLLLVEEEDE